MVDNGQISGMIFFLNHGAFSEKKFDADPWKCNFLQSLSRSPLLPYLSMVWKAYQKIQKHAKYNVVAVS